MAPNTGAIGKLTLLHIPYLITGSLKRRERRDAGSEKFIVVLNTDSVSREALCLIWLKDIQKPLSKKMTFVVAKVNNFYFCFPEASV